MEIIALVIGESGESGQKLPLTFSLLFKFIGKIDKLVCLPK